MLNQTRRGGSSKGGEVYLTQIFQWLTALNKDAMKRSNTSAHHYSGRCGQTEGTGTGDCEHIDSHSERVIQHRTGQGALRLQERGGNVRWEDVHQRGPATVRLILA